MPGSLERYYVISSQLYWEHSLKRADTGAYYLLNGSFNSRKQLEDMSEDYGEGYRVYGESSTKRCYLIRGEMCWEDELEKLDGSTLYQLDDEGCFYTQKQLEGLATEYGIGYGIDGRCYTQKYLENCLSTITQYPRSTCHIGGQKFTRQQLEEILGYALSPAYTANSFDVTAISSSLDEIQNWDGEQRFRDDDDNRSEITQTTFSTGGMDTPRATEGEDDEDDETVAKVLANLQAKIRAVKRHKRVAAEVEKLWKLLAEKEADLMECERIMALETGQI